MSEAKQDNRERIIEAANRLFYMKGYNQTSFADVADELGINANLLGRWVKQLRGDPEQAFPGHGKLKERDKEVEDLRRQVARLKGELSFLKKVSGYFAKNQR